MSEDLIAQPPIIAIPFGKPVLESTEGEPTKEFLCSRITTWRAGETLRIMLDAERYYRNHPDIMSRKREFLNRSGKTEENKLLSNTRLRHNYFRALVNQKVDFLLGKQFSINCEDKEFAKVLNETFVNDKATAQLHAHAIQAISKGISWAQAYYDAEGNLGFKRIPSEQIIPFWKDEEHQELEAAIRFYRDKVLLAAGGSSVRDHIEYWTPDGCWTYVSDGKDGDFKPDHIEMENAGLQGHFINERPDGKGQPYAWGRVPFVAFRYSSDEYSLIEDVKSLIDDYNEIDSDFSDDLKDLKQGFKVVKGYSGEDRDAWEERLNRHRVAFVDEDGGIENLDNEVQADPFVKRLDLHDKAIYKESRGVNNYGEDFGNASGKALLSRYEPLQNDCEKMGRLFGLAMREMAWFVCADLANRKKGDFSGKTFSIVWNMDMVSDESTIIDDVNKSTDLSLRTRLANHPWVTDVDKELSELEKERKTSADNNASGIFNFKSGGADDGKTGAGNDDDAED